LVAVAVNFQNIESYFTSTQNVSSSSQQIVITGNSSTTPRWNHFPLTVNIENTQYTQDVVAAMNAWTSATGGLITFTQTSDSNADITVRWVSNLRVGAKDATGDTNLHYINTGTYQVITDAQIELLTGYQGLQLSDIDMTNIAEHELGHALGLEHTTIPSDIMYPTLQLPSLSVKQISPTYSDFFHQVYSLQAKPDLAFYGNINATKFSVTTLFMKQYYLNISFAVINLGLTTSPATSISIFADSNLLINQDIPSLKPGSSYILSLDNLRSSSYFSSVRLVIDPNNAIDELNKTNDITVVQIS
jgi:predicted Zn-dependent protease